MNDNVGRLKANLSKSEPRPNIDDLYFIDYCIVSPFQWVRMPLIDRGNTVVHTLRVLSSGNFRDFRISREVDLSELISLDNGTVVTRRELEFGSMYQEFHEYHKSDPDLLSKYVSCYRR